jgi:hypothetical protein
MYANGATSWCSASLAWLSLFQSGRTNCDITISPFGHTIVAIVPERASFGVEDSAFECSHEVFSDLSVQLIATGLVGVVLVSLAPFLATSLAFRISAGGVISVLLFSLLVAFFFMRCGPSIPDCLSLPQDVPCARGHVRMQMTSISRHDAAATPGQTR